MENKGRGRLVYRIFLLAVLFIAAGNAYYVHRLVNPPDALPPPAATPAARPAVKLQLKAEADTTPALGRSSGSFPTEHWHANVLKRAEKDGGYSFEITPYDGVTPMKMTSYDLWVAPAAGGSEQKLSATSDATGKITARHTFPDKGVWLLRIRLAADLNTLEFTERVEVE